jgi:phage shock protein C
MICFKCGNLFPEDAAFCPSCGAKRPEPQPVQEENSIRRPRSGRVISGVCAGMAECFGGKAIYYRVAFVVITIITVGLLAIGYAVLSFVIPSE